MLISHNFNGLNMIKVQKGLNLPITGLPTQRIENARPVKTVAITGADYQGMKPTMLVKEGEKVKIGQPLFECKKTPGVLYTAPGSGTLKAINRGEKRVFQTMVIEIEGEEYHSFKSYLDKAAAEWSGEEIRNLLVESGLWSALRTRPFSKVPEIDSKAQALFINCMDSNPLAVDSEIVINERSEDFIRGTEALAKLTEGTTWVCQRAKAKLPQVVGDNIKTEEFSGPHPAGNVGTHIHFLDPVGPHKTIWHISYQDVLAFGRLLSTGCLSTERVVSLAGPMVKKPRLLRTRLGACLCELTEGELLEGPVRVVSGSVLNGRTKDESYCYLGRYHAQISCLEDNDEREFLGWQGPGYNKFSIKNTYAGKFKRKAFDFTTKLFGSPRAMVPVGSFEKIMPMDILPTQLLRALLSDDTDLCQDLGCLELDEEDLALCTFASPGKTDFGPQLREILSTIEKEG
jgi:Na+-transporting NADH:ubiquinone oxidoreductase subunit A